jgi:hypothetical protein
MRSKFQVVKAPSNSVPPLIVVFLGIGVIFAGAQQAVSPSPKAKINSDNGAALSTPGKPEKTTPPQAPQINPQELERLTKAADKVLNRIQTEEGDLYLRVSYFEKPERLNPNSYGSKEEVSQWEGMLEQLKAKLEIVSQLYVDVGKNLETELRASGGNEEIVAKFKKFIMDGFPWATIEKKRTLITDFIDEQAKLLTFYEKNWGSWNGKGDANNPEFTSASAANIYKRLRDQIVNTSEEIENQYKAMSE